MPSPLENLCGPGKPLRQEAPDAKELAREQACAAAGSSEYGGRVLTVVGRGADYEEAIARAYQGVAQISFEGMQYRRDIGAKARGTESR